MTSEDQMSEWLRDHEDEVNKFDILMEILFQTPRESKVLPPAWKMDVEDEAGKREHDPLTLFISVFFQTPEARDHQGGGRGGGRGRGTRGGRGRRAGR